MTFAELLALADDLTLQQLLGGQVVKLLRIIDPRLAAPSRLRAVLAQLYSPDDLLRDPRARAELISLLPREKAEELVLALIGRKTADPYGTLLNLTIRKHSLAEAKLFDFFGVPTPPNTVEPRAPASDTPTPAYPLFAHQRGAAKAAQRKLQSGGRRVLLHMPTGSGKTRTAMSIICDHLRAVEPTLVVWLAYSEELCEQAASEFETAWSALGNRIVSVQRYWAGHELHLESATDGFLVAGLSKAYNAAKRSIHWLAALADRTSLVVIDEAHQAVAETYALILNGIEVKKPGTSLLGLTATPGRTWNEIDQDEALARFFRRSKVGLEVPGGGNPVDYLVREGFLARPSFIALNHSGTLTLSDRDRRDLATSLDIPARLLERLADDEQRNLAIIQRLTELTRRHVRILVFAATVGHARLIATVMCARGIEAYAVMASTPSHERERIIRRYRSDAAESIVVCNFGVLTTGFDAPSTSAVLIARPTKSLVLYSQMVGRAIRGQRAGGNPEAEIVTVVDQSLPGFADLGEAFFNWEDVWQ